MYLVVDVGNSHTVTGIYQGDNLIGRWRLKSDIKQTADELALHYHTLLSMANIDASGIEGVVLASVVPTLENAWLECCQKHFKKVLDRDLFIVTVDNIRDLITVGLENPYEVGMDRLVNAIGSYDKVGCKHVVIDFGTAITFDCVTEKCVYIGGVILPGVAISLEALAQKTAKLPHIKVSAPPEKVIGTTTIKAMQSGTLHGYGEMVNGLIQKIKKEMLEDSEDEFKVIATGGMAEFMGSLTCSFDIIEPMLTLHGLKIIYDKYIAR